MWDFQILIGMANKLPFSAVVSPTMLRVSIPIPELHALFDRHIASRSAIVTLSRCIKVIAFAAMIAAVYLCIPFETSMLPLFLVILLAIALAFSLIERWLRPTVRSMSLMARSDRISRWVPRNLGWTISSTESGHYYHHTTTLVMNWLIHNGYYERDQIKFVSDGWKEAVDKMTANVQRRSNGGSLLELSFVLSAIAGFGLLSHLFVAEHWKYFVFALLLVLAVLINVRRRSPQLIEWYLEEMHTVRDILQLILFRFEEHEAAFTGLHSKFPHEEDEASEYVKPRKSIWRCFTDRVRP